MLCWLPTTVFDQAQVCWLVCSLGLAELCSNSGRYQPAVKWFYMKRTMTISLSNLGARLVSQQPSFTVRRNWNSARNDSHSSFLWLCGRSRLKLSSCNVSEATIFSTVWISTDLLNSTAIIKWQLSLSTFAPLHHAALLKVSSSPAFFLSILLTAFSLSVAKHLNCDSAISTFAR